MPKATTGHGLKCHTCRNWIARPNSAVPAARVEVLEDDPAQTDEGEIFQYQLCNECRVTLCSCANCSAFRQAGDEVGYCMASAPQCTPTERADFALVQTDELCRDGYQQASPIHWTEVRDKIGNRLCKTLRLRYLVDESTDAAIDEEDPLVKRAKESRPAHRSRGS